MLTNGAEKIESQPGLLEHRIGTGLIFGLPFAGFHAAGYAGRSREEVAEEPRGVHAGMGPKGEG